MTSERREPDRRPVPRSDRARRAPTSSRRSVLADTRSRATGRGKVVSVSAGGVVLVIFVVLKVIGVRDRQQYRAERAGGASEAARVCNAGQEATVLASRLLGQRGQERAAAEAYEAAAKAWKDCGAGLEAREAHGAAGWAWLDAGDDAAVLDRAEKAFREASQLVLAIGTVGASRARELHARMWGELGLANVHMRRSSAMHWRSAERVLKSAERTLNSARRDVRDDDRLAILTVRVASDLGWCAVPGHHPEGSWESALAAYRRAEQIAAELASKDSAIVAQQSLIAYQIGYCLEQGGDDDTALPAVRAAYESALRFSRAADDDGDSALTLTRLANTHMPDRDASADASLAIEHFGKAAELYKGLGDASAEAHARWNEAAALMAAGRDAEGRALLTRVEGLFRAAGRADLADEVRDQLDPPAEENDDP